ncbi:carboxypeptidase M32 [Albimonas sp. CAU 1670]|uniref:carboxypeptidase M32 n=1 Tax=Albimonas sp. CAU 1670 TaxID=3032599 RepID=UPI0023DAD3B3|nr:carboxypeptidase M32 [Albimonas sp. CAU 1670]MDF2231009.1 carboxypeptidase M32 [Albimonas sp. CAU 1670]
MTPDDAYAALLDHARRVAALEQAAGLLGWDQETMMPPRAAPQRAEQMGALAAVLHQMRTDPRQRDWLDAAEGLADPAPDVRADLREARRALDRAARLPDGLAEALARARSSSHQTWAEARGARDFAAFVPALTEVLALRREEALALADPGQDPYDALLEDYEPGARAAELEPVFARLREGLTALLDRIRGASARIPRISGAFPETAQMALAHELAADCGYDFAAGRLDRAVHPFSSGSGQDVRITTRVDPADPTECIFATMHETGHALYEQGIDPALAWRPSGTHASMGVHESQSRFWENHVGRSAAFAPFLHDRMKIAFGALGLRSPEALFAAVNAVGPGFIRTAADEAQYDLHILMRFDLERALLSGDLPVADLEVAWADRFEADFGRRPPHAALGCLQDVHWSEGLIGYFPTYTLGNLNAAALAAAMRRDLGDLDARLGRGDLAAPLAWLREKVHRHGRVLPATELMTQACGGPVDEKPMLAALEAKFGAIYGF